MAKQPQTQELLQESKSVSASRPHPAASDSPLLRLAYCLEWLKEASDVLSTPEQEHENYAFYLTELPLVIEDAWACLANISTVTYRSISSNDNH